MTILGNNTTPNDRISPSGYVDLAYHDAIQVVPSVNGTLASITAYVEATVGFATTIDIGVYSNQVSGGVDYPYQLLAHTGAINVASGFIGWKTGTISLAVTAGTKYWLAVRDRKLNTLKTWVYYSNVITYPYRAFTSAVAGDLYATWVIDATLNDTVDLCIYATYAVAVAPARGDGLVWIVAATKNAKGIIQKKLRGRSLDTPFHPRTF